eukprot:3577980-Rhodomonas_salina.2
MEGTPRSTPPALPLPLPASLGPGRNTAGGRPHVSPALRHRTSDRLRERKHSPARTILILMMMNTADSVSAERACRQSAWVCSARAAGDLQVHFLRRPAAHHRLRHGLELCPARACVLRAHSRRVSTGSTGAEQRKGGLGPAQGTSP